MKLLKDFYLQTALTAAPALLGKVLYHQTEEGRVTFGRITETEAYFGESDTACHARSGRTKRTNVLYEEGGIAYIYLCYGIHNLLNVVTGPRDFPQAVLIRAVEGFNGPGRLTRAMKIDCSLNGVSFLSSNRIWIEDDGAKPKFKATKRIGIDYATAEYRNKLWRFVIK